MKKTTFIAKILLFILTLSAFLGSAIFAWVSFVDKSQPIMLYSGRLNAEAKLFILDDPNFDDEDVNNEYTEITNAYQISHVQPGQIYSFKLEVKNTGTIPAHLKVFLEIDDTSNEGLLDVIHIAFNEPIYMNQRLESMYLFEEQPILKLETYVFYFNIVITEFLGNVYSGQSVVIKNLIITLDQIQDL